VVDSGGGVLWPLWQLSLSSVVATLQVGGGGGGGGGGRNYNHSTRT